MDTPHAAHGAKIAITYRPVRDLKPALKNARKHSKKQIRQIAESIKTFGFTVPVLIDQAGQVIAGHCRLLACELIGMTEVPTICLEHLSPAQVRAYMIADNRLAEVATWDDRLLAEQLKELSLMDLDFSLEVTGFDMAEIDMRIEGLQAEEADAADVIPEPSSIPVTQIGDVWQLGPHRIVCGNSLDPAAYAALMAPAGSAEVAFTDAPYNVEIDGHVGGHGKIKHREFAMATGEMSDAEFTQFLITVMTLMAKYSQPGSLHFHCMDWRHLPEILAAGKTAYAELKNLCVWAKDNAGMGSMYRSQHELVLVFKHGTAQHINNIQLGKYGRHRSNVWKYPGVNSFARTNEEGNLLALHPTVKPVQMVVDALLDASRRGGIVLDPFLGSGTTLLAAERTGRLCRGIELDPLYVDTAIRRWQAWTGQDALHAVTGQLFREWEAQVQAASAGPVEEEARHG